MEKGEPESCKLVEYELMFGNVLQIYSCKDVVTRLFKLGMLWFKHGNLNQLLAEFKTKDEKILKVPKVLLSGNHKEIREWRQENRKTVIW